MEAMGCRLGGWEDMPSSGWVLQIGEAHGLHYQGLWHLLP